MVVILCTVLLVLALALWRRAESEQRAAGLPRARLRYDDASAGRPLERPLVSHRYRLAGRPDFILEEAGQLIPVEAKPTRRAAEPYAGDLLQLAAYCLLVDDVLGRRPPHGLLRYADRTWEVPYDDAARDLVIATLEAMDQDTQARDVHRSHDEPARCARCGVREACTERLDID
jgi:CRISPR-associated exonuclease Cas4